MKKITLLAVALASGVAATSAQAGEPYTYTSWVEDNGRQIFQSSGVKSLLAVICLKKISPASAEFDLKFRNPNAANINLKPKQCMAVNSDTLSVAGDTNRKHAEFSVTVLGTVDIK